MQRFSPRFRSAQFFICVIFGDMIDPNLYNVLWRRHEGAHPDGHECNMAAGN